MPYLNILIGFTKVVIHDSFKDVKIRIGII